MRWKAIGWIALSVAAAGCVRHYDGRGVVVAVTPEARQVVVSHDAIPGLMEAMVMRFDLAPGRPFDPVHAGDRIEFRLKVGSERTVMERLRIVSAARTDAGLLRSPAEPTLTRIGSNVAATALVDQAGATRRFTEFRGRVVVVTFLYTRCPLPEYCPRLMAHMKALASRFAARLGNDLELAVVTFDPMHDTVDVMRTFAEHYDATGPGWVFLTGTRETIAEVCESFGVEYWPDQGLITHTMLTALVDRDARLTAVVEGKDYTARQLGDLVAAALDPAGATSR